MINQSEIEQVIAIAKAQGVKSLKVGAIEVELHPAAAAAGELDPKAVAELLARKDDPDEVLFWSAGGAGQKDKDGNAVTPPLTGEDADAAR